MNEEENAKPADPQPQPEQTPARSEDEGSRGPDTAEERPGARKSSRRRGGGGNGGDDSPDGSAGDSRGDSKEDSEGGSSRGRRGSGRGRRGGGSRKSQVRGVDAAELGKKAWQLYRGDVSEEGMALFDDKEARKLAARSFDLARIFLEERTKHAPPERDED